jgi:hypothetical protein
MSLGFAPALRNHPVAAPFAYEQPTLERAWQGLRRHLLTVVVIMGISGGLNLMGYGLANLLFGGGVEQPPLADSASSVRVVLNQLLQTPFTVVASLVSVLLTAVPALYYETGRVITPNKALQLLLQRPARYFLAGVLASVAIVVGLLFCILPGLAVAMVIPVYVNRVFVTDQPILAALVGSFQSVYGHAKGWKFLLIQLIAWLLVALFVLVSAVVVAVLMIGLKSMVSSQNIVLLIPYGLLTFGVVAGSLVGWLLLPQLSTFYVQNAAYRLGILS